MRRVLAPLILLLLALASLPTQAQALVFSFFPEFRPFTASEPAMLLVTGVVLVVLASVGQSRQR
jgi:hypothetical protein